MTTSLVGDAANEGRDNIAVRDAAMGWQSSCDRPVTRDRHSVCVNEELGLEYCHHFGKNVIITAISIRLHVGGKYGNLKGLKTA